MKITRKFREHRANDRIVVRLKLREAAVLLTQLEETIDDHGAYADGSFPLSHAFLGSLRKALRKKLGDDAMHDVVEGD